MAPGRPSPARPASCAHIFPCGRRLPSQAPRRPRGRRRRRRPRRQRPGLAPPRRLRPRRDPAPSSGDPRGRPGSAYARRGPAGRSRGARGRARSPSSRSSSYSRTARMPSPRSADFVPAVEARRSTSVRSSARGTGALVERQEVLVRPGCRRRRSGRISSRTRPRFVPAFDESTERSPWSRQYASVSSRQTVSSGRTTPSSRRGLMPFVLPDDTSRYRNRLDLVGGGVPGRAQAMTLGEGIAELAQRGSVSAGARRSHRRRGRRGRSVRRRRTRRRAGRGARAARRGTRTRGGRARAPSSRRRRRRGKGHVPAGRDQVVPADVLLDARRHHAPFCRGRARLPAPERSGGAGSTPPLPLAC